MQTKLMRLLSKRLKDLLKKFKKIYFYKNSGAELYSNLLRNCYAMLGNSSSGIVEAASFGLPVINIGNRQKGKVFLKYLQVSYKSTIY